jgi:hypothetical protein
MLAQSLSLAARPVAKCINSVMQRSGEIDLANRFWLLGFLQVLSFVVHNMSQDSTGNGALCHKLFTCWRLL